MHAQGYVLGRGSPLSGFGVSTESRVVQREGIPCGIPRSVVSHGRQWTSMHRKLLIFGCFRHKKGRPWTPLDVYLVGRGNLNRYCKLLINMNKAGFKFWLEYFLESFGFLVMVCCAARILSQPASQPASSLISALTGRCSHTGVA